MKIIIPMASTDKDMLDNYSVIKPLVKLGNKTMIETFIENCKFNFEYIFLCKQQDLLETKLLNIIQKLKLKKK
jgi:NDP-sugar pyrophosphorylase family protein